jgi:hypothetical protein
VTRRHLEVLAVIGLVGAAASVMLASPAHRAHYLAWLAPQPRALSQAAMRSEPRLLVHDRAPRVGGVPGAVVGERPDGLVAEASGRLRIPIIDAPARLTVPGIPAGWQVQVFAGQASVELVRSEIGLAFRLKSEASSFALYRGVVVDLHEFPVLSWAWKVTRLPGAGDARQRATDDQAAQVYVIFPRWPAPQSSSDVIGYIWDTTAPAGAWLVSPKATNVRLGVVESGPAGLGAWRHYRRNLRDDYVALFGRRPPRVGSIAIMTDADDTGGAAEALVGGLAFSRSEGATHSGSPRRSARLGFARRAPSEASPQDR